MHCPNLIINAVNCVKIKLIMIYFPTPKTNKHKFKHSGVGPGCSVKYIIACAPKKPAAYINDDAETLLRSVHRITNTIACTGSPTPSHSVVELQGPGDNWWFYFKGGGGT